MTLEDSRDRTRPSFLRAVRIVLLTPLIAVPVAGGQSEPPASGSSSGGATVQAAAPTSNADPVAAPPGSIEAEADELLISITPYVWAASVDATISNYGVSSSFDVGFSDILKNLELAFMLHAEVSWRRAFLFGDFEYMDIGATVNVDEPVVTGADVPTLLSNVQAAPPSFGSGPFAQALLQAEGDLNAVKNKLHLIGNDVRNALQQLTPEQRLILAKFASEQLVPRIRSSVADAVETAKLDFASKEAKVQAAIIAALGALKPGPQILSVESNMTLTLAEFGGGYRLLDWDLPTPLGDQHVLAGLDQRMRPDASRLFPVLTLDVLGGARYYNLGYSSTIMFTPDKFGILPSVVDTDQRFEWVDAIVGGRVGLSLNKEFRLWCRGDVGGFYPNSNYSWNVQGGVEWRPLQWLHVVAGYRVLDILYKNGGPDSFGFDGQLKGPFLGATFVF